MTNDKTDDASENKPVALSLSHTHKIFCITHLHKQNAQPEDKLTNNANGQIKHGHGAKNHATRSRGVRSSAMWKLPSPTNG